MTDQVDLARMLREMADKIDAIQARIPTPEVFAAEDAKAERRIAAAEENAERRNDRVCNILNLIALRLGEKS